MGRALTGVLLWLTVAGALAAQEADRPGPPTADSTRKCGPAREPRRLPAVNDMIDSAAAAQTLGVLNGRPIEVLVSLQFGESGGLAHAAVLWRNTAVDTASAVGVAVARVFRAQEPLGPRQDPWGLRIRVHTIEGLALAVERAEFCPPELVSLGTSRIGTVVLNARESAEFMRDGRGYARALVGIDGIVQNVELVNGSGSAELDRDLVNGAWQARYKPALLDGQPVAVWVDRRVELRRRP